MQVSIEKEEKNKVIKNIFKSGIVCLIYINLPKSIYGNVRKTKVFKQEFKQEVEKLYEGFVDTELKAMFDLAFEKDSETNIEPISEEMYQYQKLLKLEDDLEVEKYINPARKSKSWNAFMKKVGSNLQTIHERFEDPGLHTNQVLLTDEYDDQTSDEDIPGFDFEAKKQAELDKKKDMMTQLIGK